MNLKTEIPGICKLVFWDIPGKTGSHIINGKKTWRTAGWKQLDELFERNQWDKISVTIFNLDVNANLNDLVTEKFKHLKIFRAK